jgi:hypothetical protein
MAIQLDLRAKPLQTVAFGSISGTYTPFSSASFGSPIRIMIVQNLTNTILTYSFDGVVDHFVLPTLGQLIIDISSDEFQGNGFIVSSSTIMYVKGSPGSGSTYVSAFYAKGT